MSRLGGQRRSSLPATPNTTASTLFQYSTARPPTNYSANSWVHDPHAAQPPPVPAVPRRHKRDSELPYYSTPASPATPVRPPKSPRRPPHRTNEDAYDERGLGVAVPEDGGNEEEELYARSDWTQADQAPFTGRYSEAYTAASEYPKTAKSGVSQYGPTPHGGTASWYQPRPHGDERVDHQGPRRKFSHSDEEGEDGEEEQRWAEAPTAWSKSSYAGPKTLLETVYEDEDARPGAPGRNEQTHYSRDAYGGYEDDDPSRVSKRSTAPDMLDLHNLHANSHPALPHLQQSGGAGNNHHGQFVDSPSGYAQTHLPPLSAAQIGSHGDSKNDLTPAQLRRRTISTYHPADHYGDDPADGLAYKTGQSHLAQFLTPAAHQRLGRMSVAPARYTLPPGQSPAAGQGGAARRAGGPKQTSRASISHTRNASHSSAHSRTLSGDVPGSAIPVPGTSNPYLAAVGGNAVQPYYAPSPVESDTWLAKLANTKVGEAYMTYRIFGAAVLALAAALVLTLAMQQDGGRMSTFVRVEKGGWEVMPGEGRGVAMGVWGFCQVGASEPMCRTYKKGDFISTGKRFQIPGPDSVQSSLANMLTALTSLTWLLALYLTSTAFLHFFLLFGLSIPWNFLITAEPLPPLTGRPAGSGFHDDRDRDRDGPRRTISAGERMQKEVDLRARCERAPYEAYGWVWWAWWAHRRGPVHVVFGLLVGLLGVVTLGLAAQFYLQVSHAVKDGSASLGTGTLVPAIVTLFALDPFISAIIWLTNARHNFDAFLNPPEPAPAALLLPPNAKRMRHVRRPGGAGSYFVPNRDTHHHLAGGPGTSFIADGSNSLFSPPGLPPVSAIMDMALDGKRGDHHEPDADDSGSASAAMDEQTVRWRAAYPHDPDLVDLIASLQAGEPSDDFVLSDVGLLYLRPEPLAGGGAGAEDEGDALLVPPAGQIRQEILEDTHLELVLSDSGKSGESAHWGPETMAGKIGETFWWPGLDEDCADYVGACRRCNGRGDRRSGAIKPGMTPLAFTAGSPGTNWGGAVTGKTPGYTAGWTGEMDTASVGQSAIAAEMAFAMRRAEDEARRDAV